VSRNLSRLRPVLASAAALTAIFPAWSLFRTSENGAALSFVALLGISVVGVHLRSPSLQLLSRVAWVSAALLGGALSVGEGVSYTPGPMLAVAALLALLFAGRSGLDEKATAQAAFAPVAYRRSLVAALVVTGVALQWGLLYIEGLSSSCSCMSNELVNIASLVTVAAFAAGAVGVYRLRVWGVVLMGLSSVGVLGAALLAGNLQPVEWLLLAPLALPGVVSGVVLLACLRGARDTRRKV
jgi:hypothetical protein